MVVMLTKFRCEGQRVLLKDGGMVCEVEREVFGGMSDPTVPRGLLLDLFLF